MNWATFLLVLQMLRQASQIFKVEGGKVKFDGVDGEVKPSDNPFGETTGKRIVCILDIVIDGREYTVNASEAFRIPTYDEEDEVILIDKANNQKIEFRKDKLEIQPDLELFEGTLFLRIIIKGITAAGQKLVLKASTVGVDVKTFAPDP